ncbi:hypothetical protein RFI_39668 [Reticulomyxa filosa]|uniref:Uncharacterized protein n=1 Tax=Reticulomyxa filosa TaxID=46433 RepID=X6L8R1_RETFI|nr:hypothetical protein RFI_39668 [Reticulomyxa filosa]|eukprot:ETN97858.1 hypothetical protein RFI_39668 [Reticulomyxa filosa]
MDYVKDKLVDKDGIIKSIDEEKGATLKQKGRNFIVSRDTTFEQVYEKGMKELQVQLTTYWDYVITQEFKHKCPGLIEDWSCNVVDRLMNMKTISSNKCNEMSLAVGNKDHCIYLISSNTTHPKNESDLIQLYLVAFFQWNDPNIDQVPSHSELMKQLKIPCEEVYNGIAVEQALVAKQIPTPFKQEHFIVVMRPLINFYSIVS